MNKPIERLTYSVTEAATALGISRASCYQMVQMGEIPSIRLAGRILVPRSALERLIDQALEGEAPDVSRTLQNPRRLQISGEGGSRP